MTTQLTTELDAINRMLSHIGQSPVDDIDCGDALIVIAREELKTCVREVLLMRDWDFATEYEYPLKADEEGKISIPGLAIRVVIDDHEKRYTVRGTLVYDKIEHTYVINKDLTATIGWIFDWDLLPEAIKYYCYVRAARKFQAKYDTSEKLYKLSEKDEFEAKEAAERYESETSDLNMLWDNPEIARALRNRPNYY